MPDMPAHIAAPAPMSNQGINRERRGVWGALFDKPEARILSWSNDGIVRLWDAATGTACRRSRGSLA